MACRFTDVLGWRKRSGAPRLQREDASLGDRALKIGIIGAGFIGRALAAHAMRHGHAVMTSNSRSPETLGSTVVALGCRAGTPQQAAEFGDAIAVAIPFKAYRAIPVDPVAGKPVLDANNHYPDRDGRFHAGPLAEGWRLQRAMPAYCIPLDMAGLEAALATAQRGVEMPYGSWRR